MPRPPAFQPKGGRTKELPRRRLLLKGLFPVVLLAGFLGVFFRFGPLGVFRAGFPPVEELTVERIEFPAPGQVRVHVVNGGPEAVRVSQVMVDQAYWDFRMSPNRPIPRLRKAVVDIPYPWVQGEPLEITLLSSTGVTFTAEVEVATTSPAVNARYLSTFTLLGLYVGVIPVFLGLLWLPFLMGIGARWLDFFLSLTLGLLVFLGVDALQGAIELAGEVASAFQGVGLITLGLLGTPLVVEAVGRRLRRGGGASPVVRASYLIAFGIGLHNLGEGLAVGAAYAVGEIALGTGLVLGFLLHNTTEGIAIVAPIAHERVSLARLAALGAIAGVPTILGAWIGGFSYSPITSVLFLAVGAGAIVQVVWVLSKLLARREGGGLTAPLNAAGVVVGLVLMYVTGLLVAV